MNDVVFMASTHPAQLYGLNKGKIEVGYDSDILVVNDHFDILAVMSQGEVKRNQL